MLPKKPKERPFRLLKRFFTNRKSQKNLRVYPLIEFKTLRKKLHSAKKPKGGPFGLHFIFGLKRKFCDLARDSNQRSRASQTPDN